MIDERRFLLDTNVVSESRKRQPSQQVEAFLRQFEESQLFLSVLTLGEVHRGYMLQRRVNVVAAARLAVWITDLETRFDGRILPVDHSVAFRWGELSADRTRPAVDTLIAATALVHDLTLVTRNVRDMRGLNVRMIDPWESV